MGNYSIEAIIIISILYIISGFISYAIEYSSDMIRYEKKKPGCKYHNSKRKAGRIGWYRTVIMCGPYFIMWRIIKSTVKNIF